MILREKISKWARDGVVTRTGGDYKGGKTDGEILLKLNLESFDDGTFEEAVFFAIYKEGFIETIKNMREVTKEIKTLVKEEAEILGIIGGNHGTD